MALTPEQQATVTEIAALCENPQDKDSLAGLLARNEAAARGLHEGRLRQSDYDRMMNAEKAKIAAKEQELTTNITKYQDLYTANKKWKTDNEGKVVQAGQRITQLEQDKVELEKKILEAASRAVGEGGEVKPEEVKKMIDDAVKASHGGLTPEAVAKLVNDAVVVAKAEGQKEFIEQTLPLQTAFAMDMVEVNQQHKDEFGTFLPREEFSKFCNDNGHRDPKKAFEAFVSEKRHKKELETATAKAAEDARKTQEEKDRAAYAASVSLPGSGAGPDGQGPVQARIQAARQAAQVVPGGGAAAAAQEYRETHARA